MLNRAVLLSARVGLVLVLLVVLAGSVVRSTGSGMGCPDWPKCFGYYIPPTDIRTLTWQEGRDYPAGVMVIRDEALWVAERAHTAGDFPSDPWSKYEVHSYAEFNAAHTWTEYINRLLGALSGIPVLLLFLFSLISLRQRPVTFVLAAATLFLLGFVAWLGKVVVDSHLAEHKITLHMAGALGIVALLVASIRWEGPRVSVAFNGRLMALLALGVGLALLQVFLGTQVREGVDALLREGTLRQDVPEALPAIFYTHRTIAWLVIIVNALIWVGFRKLGLRSFWAQLPALVVLMELLSGVVLVYAGMPAAMQPVHLLAGFFLFASLWYWLLGGLLPNRATYSVKGGMKGYWTD